MTTTEHLARLLDASAAELLSSTFDLQTAVAVTREEALDTVRAFVSGRRPRARPRDVLAIVRSLPNGTLGQVVHACAQAAADPANTALVLAALIAEGAPVLEIQEIMAPAASRLADAERTAYRSDDDPLQQLRTLCNLALLGLLYEDSPPRIEDTADPVRQEAHARLDVVRTALLSSAPTPPPAAELESDPLEAILEAAATGDGPAFFGHLGLARMTRTLPVGRIAGKSGSVGALIAEVLDTPGVGPGLAAADTRDPLRRLVAASRVLSTANEFRAELAACVVLAGRLGWLEFLRAKQFEVSNVALTDGRALLAVEPWGLWTYAASDASTLGLETPVDAVLRTDEAVFSVQGRVRVARHRLGAVLRYIGGTNAPAEALAGGWEISIREGVAGVLEPTLTLSQRSTNQGARLWVSAATVVPERT
ncbi:MAG: hypothetical protein U0353_06960 [Sandaracinus sp.]